MRDYPGQQSRNNDAQPDCDTPCLMVSATADQVNSITDELKSSVSTSTAKSLPQLDILTGDSTDGAPAPSDLATVSTDGVLPDIGFIDFSVDSGWKDEEKKQNITNSDTSNSQDLSANLKDNEFISAGSPGDHGKVGANVTHSDDKTGKQSVDLNPANPAPNSVVANFERTGERIVPVALEHYPNSTRWLLAQGLPQIGEYFDALDSSAAAQALSALQQDAARDPKLQQQFRVLSLLDAELRTHEAAWFLQFGGKTVPADTLKQHLSEGVTDLLRLAPPDFAQKIKSRTPKEVDEYLKTIADPVAREAAETLAKYAKSGTLADHLPDAKSTIDAAHKIENHESHKAAADFLKNPYDAPARSRAINTLKDVDRVGKTNSLSEEVRDLEALDLALKYIKSGDSKEAQTNAIELITAAEDGNEFAKRILVKMAGKHDFKEMIEKARAGDRDMLASMKQTWSPEEALGELRAKDGHRELARNPTPEKLEELLKQLSKDCTTAGVDLKRFLAVEQALRELEQPDTSTKALKHLQCEALEDNPHARAALSIILSEDRNLVGRDKMYVPDLAEHTVQQRNEIKKQAVETLTTLLEKGESLSESEFTAMATALSSRALYATGGKALRESIEATVDRACNQPSDQLDPASVFKNATQTETALSGIFRAITTGGANQKAAGQLYLRAAGSVNNKFAIHDGQTAGREFGKQIDGLCGSRNNSDATITILAGLTKGVGEQNTSDNANPEHKRIHPDSKIKSLDHGALSYKASEALIKAASKDPKIRDAVMATLSTDTAGKDSSTLDEKTLAATAVLSINDIPDYVHKSLQRSVLEEKTDPMGAVDAMLKLGKAVSDQDADRVVQILLETGHKDPQKAAAQLLRMADTAESTYVKSVAVLALGAKNWQGANLEVKGSEEFMRLLRIKEANKDNPTIELAVAKLTHGAGQPLSIAATLKEKGCQLDDQALHALVDKASQKYSTEQMQRIIHQMVMYNALPETLRSEFSGSPEKLDEGQTISLGGRHIDATTVNSSEHLRVLLLGGKDLQLAESVPVLKAMRDLSADAVNKLPLDFAAKLRGGKVAPGEAIPVSVLANCGISQEELSHLKAEQRQLLEGVLVFAPVSQSVPDLSNKAIPASEFNLLTDAVRAKLNDGKTDLLQNGASMSLSGKTLDADTVNLLPPKLRQYLTGSQAPLQQGRVLVDLSTIKIDAKLFNDLTPGQRQGLTSTSQRIDSLSLLGQMANHTLDAKDSRIAFLASPDFEKKIVAARDAAVKKQESLELDLGNLVYSKDKKLSELARHTTDGMSTWESITSIGHDLEKSVWTGLPTVLTDDSQFEKTQRDLVKAIGFTETALSSDVLDMQRTVARLKGLDVATKAFEYSTANAKGERNQADECALNTSLHYGLGGINNSSEMKTGLLATGEGINAGVFSRRGLPGEKVFETLLQKDYSTDPTGSAATVDALDLLSALRPTEHLSKRNDTSVIRNVALQQIDSTPAFVKLRDLNQRVFADLSVLQKEIEAGVNGDKCEDFFKDTQQRAARIKEALKSLDQKDFDQLRELRDSIQDGLGVKQDQPGSITDAESRKALKDRATAINSILENLDREQPRYKADSEHKLQLQKDIASLQQRVERPVSAEQFHADQRLKESKLSELRQINQSERDGNGRGRLDRVLSELAKPEWKVNDWADWVKHDGVVMAASIGSACAAVALATAVVVASGGTALPLVATAAALSAGGMIGSQAALEAQHGLGMRSHGSEIGDHLRGERKVNTDGTLRDSNIVTDVAGKYLWEFSEGTVLNAAGIYGGEVLGEILQPFVNRALITAGISLGKAEEQAVVEAVKRSVAEKFLTTAGQTFSEHLTSMSLFSIASESTKAVAKVAIENAGVRLSTEQEKALDLAIVIGLGGLLAAARPMKKEFSTLELKHSELKQMGGIDSVARELELKGLIVTRTPQGNLSATHPDGRILEIRAIPDSNKLLPAADKSQAPMLAKPRIMEYIQANPAAPSDSVDKSIFESPRTMPFPPDPIKTNDFILRSFGRSDLAKLIQLRDTVQSGEQTLLREDIPESTKREIRETVRVANTRLSMLPLDGPTEAIVSKLEKQYRPVLDAIRDFAVLKADVDSREAIVEKIKKTRDPSEAELLREVAEKKEIDLQRKFMETEIQLLRAAKDVEKSEQFQVLKLAYAEVTNTFSPGTYKFRGIEPGSEHLDGMTLIIDDVPVSQKFVSDTVASLIELGHRPNQLKLRQFDSSAYGHFDPPICEIMISADGGDFRVVAHESGHLYSHQFVNKLPAETQNVLRDSHRKAIAGAGDRMADVTLGAARDTTNPLVKQSMAQDLVAKALADPKSVRSASDEHGQRARYFICDSEVFAEMSAFHAEKQRLVKNGENPTYRQLVDRLRACSADRARILDTPEFEQHYNLLEKLVFDPRVEAQKAFKTHQDKYGLQETNALQKGLQNCPTFCDELELVEAATGKAWERLRGTIVDQLFAKAQKLNLGSMDTGTFDPATKARYDEYCRLKDTSYDPAQDKSLSNEARARLVDLLDTVRDIQDIAADKIEHRFDQICKKNELKLSSPPAKEGLEIELNMRSTPTQSPTIDLNEGPRSRDQIEKKTRNTDDNRLHERRLRLADQEEILRRTLDRDFTDEEQVVIKELRDGGKIKDLAVMLLMTREQNDFSAKEIESVADQIRKIKMKARAAGILD